MQIDKRAYGKPHYIGEIGVGGGGGFNMDQKGLQVHDALWVAMATGGSGLAAPWYWESIHTAKLYGLFGAAATFASGIDWPGEDPQPVVPRFEWQTRPETPCRAKI